MRTPRVLLPFLLLAVAACTSSCTSATTPDPSTRRATRLVAPRRSAPVPEPGRSPSPTPAAPIAWRACDRGQCATLSVPLDWTHPGGRQVDLALFRARARAPQQRIGSLLVNPGGPGAPGTELARALATDLPAELLDRFDLVGWDPRGTGESGPVDCGRDLDYLFAGTTNPTDTAQLRALETENRRFAQACAQRSGSLLPYIGTDASVRDMDAIRAALGEDKLTYLGYSYGTLLGALYAQAFPTRVRALVLDGAVDPELRPEDAALQQAEGLERGLQAFLFDCASRRDCPWRPGGDPIRAYDALVAQLRQHPLHVRTGGRDRVLSPAELDIAVGAALYSSDQWNDLARALADASQGNGTGLARLFDAYMERSADGAYTSAWPAFIAISCLDGRPLGNAAAFARAAADAAARAPHFGATNVYLGLECAYWPVPAIDKAPVAVHAPGAPPIVVVGTIGDPITPIMWAQALARELGPARLVIATGDSHTSFPRGDRCLDPVVVSYLVDLAVPTDGLRCG